MKRLTLIRHAKSSWAFSELTDFDRPLNKRGFRDLSRMAGWLSQHVNMPDVMYSSPAIRARTTAEGFASILGVGSIKFRPELYHATAEELLYVVTNDVKNLFDHVLLVGHNPGMTELVQLLSGMGLVNMPTCGIASFTFDRLDWHMPKQWQGTFELYCTPKKLGSKDH